MLTESERLRLLGGLQLPGRQPQVDASGLIEALHELRWAWKLKLAKAKQEVRLAEVNIEQIELALDTLNRHPVGS